MGDLDSKEKKTGVFKLDIIIYVLWLIIMWGFLAILTFVPSPKDNPGPHELIALIYFFGISFIFLFIYLYIVKKKV